MEASMLKMSEIEPYYRDQDGHGIDHVIRVHRMAMWIAEQVNADLAVVNAAALLHDIARHKETNGQCSCHAAEGATMAADILLKDSRLQESKIHEICYCIAVHRFSKGKMPETLEAKVIQDADRLDALGAICIARVFMYTGLHKLPMHDDTPNPEASVKSEKPTGISHFYSKILKLKPETFHTEPAIQIAHARYEFTELFLRNFLDEWYGKGEILSKV